MSKKIILFLGNGFSIDLMSKLSKTEEINLTNLFAKGMDVPWPESDKPGFLSFQYCKNLWTLGARPYMDSLSAITLIENVITCANILHQRVNFKGKIYIDAYNELEQYLMSLFVYYTEKLNLNSRMSKDKLKDWGWKNFLEKLNNDPEVDKVHVVSLNYDIWLEQLLKIWKIPYSMDGFGTLTEKFIIYKPHGSIAFHSRKKDKAAYEIQYKDTLDDHKIDEFTYDVSHLDCLNMVNAIIPPAGDSTRMKLSWSLQIKEDIRKAAKSMNVDDMVVLCGLSYWHVDRSEIDDYLSLIPSDIKNVIMVNPNPPEVLNAVLMTLFDRYNVYNNSENLVRL